MLDSYRVLFRSVSVAPSSSLSRGDTDLTKVASPSPPPGQRDRLAAGTGTARGRRWAPLGTATACRAASQAAKPSAVRLSLARHQCSHRDNPSYLLGKHLGQPFSETGGLLAGQLAGWVGGETAVTLRHFLEKYSEIRTRGEGTQWEGEAEGRGSAVGSMCGRRGGEGSRMLARARECLVGLRAPPAVRRPSSPARWHLQQVPDQQVPSRTLATRTSHQSSSGYHLVGKSKLIYSSMSPISSVC